YGGLYGGEFTTALVRGCGYENSTYPADTNSNKAISLNEAYFYTKANVHESDVQVYPDGDNAFALMEYSEADASHVTSIQLNKERLSLKVDQSETLTATVLPGSAGNKAVTWQSSNTAVATVSDNGTVYALTPGTANITATTVDGNKTAICQLVVSKTEAEPVTNWTGPAEPVEENKSWTISFNQPVDTITVLEKNIFVTDENGIIVPQKYYIDRTGGGKLVTLTPENSYTNGSTYYLNIQNVMSQTGQSLKESIRMRFIIREQAVG
ncbi:MAG: Ig-like domain-containing protein, partial [Syntrophomonas sp.]